MFEAEKLTLQTNKSADEVLEIIRSRLDNGLPIKALFTSCYFSGKLQGTVKGNQFTVHKDWASSQMLAPTFKGTVISESQGAKIQLEIQSHLFVCLALCFIMWLLFLKNVRELPFIIMLSLVLTFLTWLNIYLVKKATKNSLHYLLEILEAKILP